MKMLVADKKQERQMNEFGKTLNKIMVQHDVYKWQDLRERLEGVGYKIGQSRLSQYLYGDRNPRNPQDLFDALAAALELDEEEKMRLVYAFAYPNREGGRGITDEDIERAAEAEEAIRRQAGVEGEAADRPTDRRV